jgi:hypothetical protein
MVHTEHVSTITHSTQSLRPIGFAVRKVGIRADWGRPIDQSLTWSIGSRLVKSAPNLPQHGPV